MVEKMKSKKEEMEAKARSGELEPEGVSRLAVFDEEGELVCDFY